MGKAGGFPDEAAGALEDSSDDMKFVELAEVYPNAGYAPPCVVLAVPDVEEALAIAAKSGEGRRPLFVLEGAKRHAPTAPAGHSTTADNLWFGGGVGVPLSCRATLLCF